MTLEGSTAHTVVGMILHADGTLRLFLDSNGRMYAEVVGFDTDRGRSFLGSLGQLEDISSEILVCDNPEVYGLGRPQPRAMHYRRTGTDAAPRGGRQTEHDRAAPRP